MKHTPFYPIHPGEILKDEIEYRQISQKNLAKQMGISYSMLNEILNGKRPVTATIALLIEVSLGLDAEMFVSMQARYNLQTARQDKDVKKRIEFVSGLYPSLHQTAAQAV